MTRAVITDIEGTTSSLSFVKDVLFPYARQRMPDFIRAHRDAPEVRRQLEGVRTAVGRPLSEDECIAQLVRWIDEDRKITPLKALQGLIWEEGYRQGHYSGHVYEDAVRQLRKWKASGTGLYVFSSGSVHAQRLLFAHTAHGDLTPLFSGYFDTTVGAKKEPDSYRAIARAIGQRPSDVLFLSDVREELDAARAAGMQTAWLVREADPDPSAAHPQVNSFDQITVVSQQPAAVAKDTSR